MRIILIDDEPAIILVLEYLLKKLGHEVLSFEDPTCCPLYNDDICDCDQRVPCCDLLITDHHMPRMTGLEFVKRQTYRGCKGVVKNKAIMSGALTPEEVAFATELGCKVFHKPMDITELINWVREREVSQSDQGT